MKMNPASVGSEATNIRDISLRHDKLHAFINLDEKGVFIVQLTNANQEIMVRRFVECSSGGNDIQLLTGFLQQGQYLLSIVKGNFSLKKFFAV